MAARLASKCSLVGFPLLAGFGNKASGSLSTSQEITDTKFLSQMDTELQSIRKLSSIKVSRTSSIASRSETPDQFDIDEHRYTSLKDIIVTNSPSWHNAMTSRSCDQFNDFDPSNILIKNQLVKRAASAYVQSTAFLVSRHQNCFHKFWEQVNRRVQAINVVSCLGSCVCVPLRACFEPVCHLVRYMVGSCLGPMIRIPIQVS